MALLRLAAERPSRLRPTSAEQGLASSQDADKALRYFDAACLEEAEGPARRMIAGVARCPRCSRVLAQRFDRLGSTLFYDDDPRMLIRAFDRSDHDACTLRVLAACIILYGRERTTVATVH